METITITLDGVTVSGREGMTILELAQEMEIAIPTLCHDPCLKPAGACRVCLVEEQTTGRLLASCITPIAPGMRIVTKSPLVEETRRVIIKLMISNHPESCVICDKGNRCRLRQLAAELGIGHIDYDRIPSYVEVEDLNPFLSRDLSKCILCGKCIRADHELVVVGALDYIHRGFRARPATLFETPLDLSDCTFCGSCVAMCPTGALMEKDLPHRGTVSDRVATTCAYCGCGCTMWLYTLEDRIVKTDPLKGNPLVLPALCVRGHYGSDYLDHPDRLQYPLLRKGEELEPASWEEALDYVAERLKGITEQWGPESVGFFGSTQCTNEENYLFQKIARAGIGSPHVDNGSRLHAFSSIKALWEVLGTSTCTNPLQDLVAAEVIFVIGAQPLESHPVASYRIKQAVRHKGAKLIYVSILEDPLSHMADFWLRIPPGTESILIMGLISILIREGLWCRDLLKGEPKGWKTFQKKASMMDLSLVEEATGVNQEALRRVVRLMSSTRRCAVLFGPLITLSSNPLPKVKNLAYLALLLGCLGVSGGGLYPLDRSANTQGACDMGTLPEWLPGYESVEDPASLSRFEALWGRRPPGGPGWSLCEMLKAAQKGRLKALFVMGEDPAGVLPPVEMEPLRGLDFLVVQDLFPTKTAQMAHVVLPAAGFAEKDGTFTSMERRVQRIRAAKSPPGSAKPDWWILSEILHRLDGTGPYESPADVMKEISHVVPTYRGIQYSRIEVGGLFCPCPDERSPGEAILFRGGLSKLDMSWQDGALERPKEPNPDFPLWAFRGETHFHYSGGTRSKRASRLSTALPQCQVHLNPKDAAPLSLRQGDLVQIHSMQGTIMAQVSFQLGIPEGYACVVPGPEGGTMAHLAQWQWDPICKTPTVSATTCIRLERPGERQ